MEIGSVPDFRRKGIDKGLPVRFLIAAEHPLSALGQYRLAVLVPEQILGGINGTFGRFQFPQNPFPVLIRIPDKVHGIGKDRNAQR